MKHLNHIKVLHCVLGAFLLVTVVGCSTLSSTQRLGTSGDPLDNLTGDWDITTFVFGGGNSGQSTCGLSHKPTSIAPHLDGILVFSAICKDGSELIFGLKRSVDKRAYHLTVKSKEGISVSDFPVEYKENQGWAGFQNQGVGDKEVSITATIQPIEGRNWYGWTIEVLPTADINVDYKTQKTPHLRLDLTRRK